MNAVHFEFDQPSTSVVLHENGTVHIHQDGYIPGDEPQEIVIDPLFLATFIEWLSTCAKEIEAQS